MSTQKLDACNTIHNHRLWLTAPGIVKYLLGNGEPLGVYILYSNVAECLSKHSTTGTLQSAGLEKRWSSGCRSPISALMLGLIKTNATEKRQIAESENN